jgi:hypothetical protein
MRESEFRALAGYPQALSFGGRDWAVRKDGLAALLRYTRAAGDARSEMSEGLQRSRVLAAAHHLIEDCVSEFGAFSEKALTVRPDDMDIIEIVNCLFRFYCCRSHWSAMRLLGYVAGNMSEIDGKLLHAGGKGLAGFSAREACNLALAMCLEGRDEEDRMFFMEDLEFEGDPDGEAIKAVRQMQRDKREREASLGG